MTDRTTDAILDAARESVARFGIRRTTLSDIARLAGVSRMTVYRRYPDLPAVIRDLMTREFGSLMDEIDASVDGPDGRARLVARAHAAVRALREHPLLRKLLETEPELLLPYLLGRLGQTQRHVLDLVSRDVAEGQADGSIRPGDPRTLAFSVLLTTQSFLFSAGTSEEVEEDAMLEELPRLLYAALRP
jgi:AcrR family transcriptional regulator